MTVSYDIRITALLLFCHKAKKSNIENHSDLSTDQDLYYLCVLIFSCHKLRMTNSSVMLVFVEKAYFS